MSKQTIASASRWRFVLILVAALAPGTASADDAKIVAHPALWTIHGAVGTAYLLGSVHALPPNVSWRSNEIDSAAKAADTYIFEVPNGQAEVDEATRYIRERGRLPEGKTLHDMLSTSAHRDYAAACALAGMDESSLDDKRPWLAAIVLTVAYMKQRHLTSTNSPDDAYFETALRDGKALRYLDTTHQQLEFLSRYDQTKGVDGFSAMLGDFARQPEREDALISAWASGNLASMSNLIERSFENDPEDVRLIAERNRVWASKLEDLLSNNHSYFVVVGIAHLVGKAGVPALLRADKLRVEGP
jgi:uncharacterized protein YbaP (TraB family)